MRARIGLVLAVLVGFGVALSMSPGTAAAGPSWTLDEGGTFHYANPGLRGESTSPLRGVLEVVQADPGRRADGTPDGSTGWVATLIRSGKGRAVAVQFDDAAAQALKRVAGGSVSAEAVGAESSGYRIATATVRPPPGASAATQKKIKQAAVAGPAPPLPMNGPFAHHAYVAVIDNSGNYWSEANAEDDASREAVVRSAVQQTLDWWRGESGGQISSYTIEGYAHYTSTQPNPGPSPCGPMQKATFAGFEQEAAAKFAADFTATGNHLILVLAPDCSGDAAGLAYTPARSSGFNSGGTSHVMGVVLDAANAFEALTHEMGHNFALDHAFWRDPDGELHEYADEFSPMSAPLRFGDEQPFAPPRLSQGHREQLSVQGTQEVDLVSGAESLPGVDLTINARGGTADPRAVQVPIQACPPNTFEIANGNPDPQCTAWVEFRNGGGFDTESGYLEDQLERFPTGVTATLTYPDSASTFLVAAHGYNVDGVGSFGTCGVIDLGSAKVTVMGTAAETATVHLGPLPSICPSPEPTISGTPRVDEHLTATATGWDAGATFTYQWNLDGKAIVGATGVSYQPVPGDVGKNVTVTVVGSMPSRESATRTSLAVGPVTKAGPEAPVVDPRSDQGGSHHHNHHRNDDQDSNHSDHAAVPLLITSGR
jgi:hypothetical protein